MPDAQFGFPGSSPSGTSTGAVTSPANESPPAILGGAPAITLPQDQANRWPVITTEDEESVLRVLRSGALSINEEVDRLEDDVRQWLGVKHVVAHNNGTGAIHAAMHAFDLKPGDEVIVPSATWWASVMPVLHHGAIPVFAETERECLGLDPEDVAARITPRTRAIVVVHLFGIPSKMDELVALARKHDLKILEDASHAHGATYRERPIGTIGDAAVFSMQGNKLVPSAEGGLLVTNDDAIRDGVVRYGHYERLLPMKTSPLRRFAATGFGMKYRMSPLSAAVARVQLRHLDERNRIRNANCRYVSERLEPLGFQTFMPDADIERVYFEFLIGTERLGVPASVLGHALRAEGALIEAPRYPLLHQQPMFTEGTWAQVARLSPDDVGGTLPTYAPDALPRTIAGNGSMLKLPSFPSADRALLDQYVTAFRRVVAHAADLPREAE